jgi:hypothetical protein
VGGRLKSDNRFSKNLVYNNFPVPGPTADERDSVVLAATTVLQVREDYATETLASLYDDLVMPIALRHAHEQLDKSVDSLFHYDGPGDELDRVAYLLQIYDSLASPT